MKRIATMPKKRQRKPLRDFSRTCRRCGGKPDDPSLIRREASTGHWASIAITLCRRCYEEALALMQSRPEAPHAALKHWRIPPTHPEYEDWVQQLQLLYWRCCVDYNPAHGIAFSTYTLDSLIQGSKSLFRQQNTHGFSRIAGSDIEPLKPVSLSVADAQGRNRPISDQIAGSYLMPDEFAELSETQLRVERAIQKLPPREAFVIRARHLEVSVWSLDEIGKYLGVCKERVRQLEIRALAQLKLILEQTGAGACT